MNIIDVSKEKLINFKADFERYKVQNLTESDTRSKVLDKIFLDILGWGEEDVYREGHTENGYFDYKLSIPNFQFIVEAKKNYANFIFPDSGGNKLKLKTLINKGNDDAVTQIRNYLIATGLTTGVISNGHQFIIARFVNQDGTDWKDNDCIIFRNLNEVEADFLTFYNLLSRISVVNNRTIKIFKEEIKGQTVLEKLNISNYGATLVRNELSTKLLQVISDVFENIHGLDDKETLRWCYIENQDTRKQNSELGILFPDDPPSFDDKIQKIRNTANTREKIKNEISKIPNSTPNPIIIIGGKGAGKTTFIKYFLEITLAEDRQTKDVPVVYLNFENSTPQQIQDTKNIYAQIINDIEDVYSKYELTTIGILKKIYKEEINKNLLGIWNYIKDDKKILEEKISEFIKLQIDNKINHLKKIADYLRTEFKIRLCIVLDNADQLDDKSQEEIFLLSQSIYNTIRSLVIISLREGFYYKWRHKPPFDAYPSLVFHITAPPYKDILKKRMEYVLSRYDFSKLRGSYENKTYILTDEKLKQFFGALYNTFFDEHNDEILKFLGETSYPNVRLFLKKVRLFLLSGHTKITTYIVNNFEKIPIWDFIKAISLESKYYYDSKSSIIHNIFYPAPDDINHFTKIRLLNYLLDNTVSGSEKNSFKTINFVFGKAGYAKNVIVSELKNLLEYGLMETERYSSDTKEMTEIDDDENFKITLAGKYYISELITRSVYIDLISQDTPVYSLDKLEEMGKIFPVAEKIHGNRNMEGRLKTISSFIEYLKLQEDKELDRSGNTTGVRALDFSIVDYIRNSPQFKTDIDKMNNFLLRSSADLKIRG